MRPIRPMPSPLTYETLELDREIASPSRISIPRLAKFALLGLGAYVLVLVATLPAGAALKWAGAGTAGRSASGTIWNGSAALGPGMAASWRVRPLRSLGRLAVAADVSVDGPGTALTGRAGWRPGTVEFDDVAGRAGWPLVAALAPRLPLACDFGLAVEMRKLVVAGARSRADGKMTSGTGICRSPGGNSAQLPPLVAVASSDRIGSRVVLTPLASGTVLAQASLARDGTVRAAILPAGSALLPAGAFPGGVTLETKL